MSTLRCFMSCSSVTGGWRRVCGLLTVALLCCTAASRCFARSQTASRPYDMLCLRPSLHVHVPQVPLGWQVPVGVVEYAMLSLGCNWMDARTGQPPSTLLQHLGELCLTTLLPTALIWWWSRAPGQHPGAWSAWGQGAAAEGVHNAEGKGPINPSKDAIRRPTEELMTQWKQGYQLY